MKLKIGAKVNFLLIIALFVVGGVSLFFSISGLQKQGKLTIDEYRTSIIQEKRESLKNMVNAAYGIAKFNFDNSIDKKNALDTIGAIRYGKEKKGYFFIQDSKGVNILHPVKPELQGKKMIDTTDPTGKYLFKELIRAAAENKEGGFVTYMWPKPGLEDPVEKLSFCKKLDEWDWNIGTGIYVDDVSEAIAKKEKDVKKNITKEIVKIATIVLLFMIGAIIVSYFVIVKGVVGPIKKIIAMLKDIAEGEGDLTKRIDAKSGDEIEELAAWFNKFIGNTRDMITTVKNDSEKLNESSKNLAGISEHLSDAASTTSSKASTVAAASEEMTSNLNSVASAMEQASANVNMVASASEEMSSTISEIAQNAEKARSITDDAVTKTVSASTQINELSKAAKEIGQVVESITDISEQVNLLALNATIEAARAGDAGKGFAVVANEIKDLANQTATSSNEIKERVGGIQQSTENTITEIASISKVVTEINEIVSTIATAVEEQSATTKEINENVSQVSSGIEDVNNNVSEGSVASQEVTKEISEVNQSSDEIAKASSNIKTDAEKLSELSQNLAEMMKKFKV